MLTTLRHRFAVLFLALPCLNPVALADPADADAHDYDIRLDPGKAATVRRESYRDLVRDSAGTKAQDLAAERTRRITADLHTLRSELPFVLASPSPFDREAYDVIAPHAGAGRFLTPPHDGGGHADILRDFMKRYPALYGLDARGIDALEVEADYSNPGDALSWVVLRQSVHGVPVFQGEVRAGFTGKGELIRTIAYLAADVDAGKTATDFGDPANAVARAAQSLGYPLLPGQLTWQAKRGPDDRVARFERGPFVDTIEAERVYFPTDAGVLRAAWRVLLWERHLAWYAIVDAADGSLLWRKNLTAQQSQPASFTVYAEQSPAPLIPPPVAPDGSQPAGAIARQALVPLLRPFNNLGWITDGNNTTDGNNVEAGLDIDGVNGVDPGSHAVGNPFRVFAAAYDPYPGVTLPSDAAFRQGVVANVFFWANTFHDRMYDLGFTELARNYQNDNFGRGGVAGDRISAEVQDSVGTNNANFAIGADGTRGRYQIMLWTATTPDTDGGLDQDVLLHEFAHGVSGRLVGNGTGLTGPHAGGLGEGWSDCAALFLQARAGDSLSAVYPIGEYATGGISPNNHYYGIRRFPYARMSSLGGPMNRPHNPLTFADIDPAQIDLDAAAYPRGPLGVPTATAAHSMAEIWCSALFEIHALLIERHGFDMGNQRMLQLMVNGMKLTPNAPDFLDARDAFIAAAEGMDSGDEAQAWTGFAIRGMGIGASVGPGTAVVESFEAPQLQQMPALSFSDAACNGNGIAEPAERLQLTVPVTNTSGTTITGATLSLNGGPVVSYGSIAPGATQSREMGLLVPAGHACGAPLPLSFALDGSAGPTLAARELAVGQTQVVMQEAFDGVAAGTLPALWSGLASGTGAVPWTTMTSHPTSPPNAAGVTLPATPVESDLRSPVLPAGATVLRFSHQYGLETNFDGGVLEISIDGGMFFDIIVSGGSFLSGGYDATLTGFAGCAGTPNPLGERPAWTGTPGVPRTTTVQLPAAVLDHPFQLRWRAGSDCSVASGTGWHIDDVQIEGAALCEVSACTLETFEDGFETPP